MNERGLRLSCSASGILTQTVSKSRTMPAIIGKFCEDRSKIPYKLGS